MVWQEFCSYTKKKEDFNEDEILEFLKHSMGYGRAPSGAHMIIPLSPGHIVKKFVLHTNLSRNRMGNIFRTGMNSTFMWAMHKILKTISNYFII